MKFTESPVVELSVRGKVVSVQQDNASFHVGTSVWPCSLVVVKFAERWVDVPNPYGLEFRSKRGVELGAGCGVGGMGLFLLGLTDIVLTDIAPVMPALKHNLKRNKALLSNKTLKHSQLYWNNPNHIAALNPPFDVVLATDVVYIPDSVAPLLHAMASLVSDTGLVLLGYQLRCPDAHRLFWQLAPSLFHIEEVPHHHLHPDYAFEDSHVFIFRKKLLSV